MTLLLTLTSRALRQCLFILFCFHSKVSSSPDQIHNVCFENLAKGWYSILKLKNCSLCVWLHLNEGKWVDEITLKQLKVSLGPDDLAFLELYDLLHVALKTHISQY